MLISEIISQYLNAIVEGIKQDAAAKNQKIPVSSFRVEVNGDSGKLLAADHFKYLVQGRGPGKFPPPDKMLEFVQNNPQVYWDAQRVFANITEQGLAFIIGRKIAREGTDIFTGKKQGINLQGAIEAPKEDFLKRLAYYKTLDIVNRIKAA